MIFYVDEMNNEINDFVILIYEVFVEYILINLVEKLGSLICNFIINFKW